MHEVKVNTNKNRLYLTIKGRYTVPEITEVATLITGEAKKLKANFGIVSDISEFVPASEEVRLIMQDTMKKLKDMGLGHVVRVIKSDAVVAANQWQRTSRAAGYTADQAETVAEADKKLDELQK
ncbi:MAG TPA: hypothetical protein PKW33_09305 [Anaerolineaceae bacterium]|nr:hypothetical protein [Anaerolineaceae bacterium]HPN51772.1 hypothetical protein [Anaerolineaceae bacterium]